MTDSPDTEAFNAARIATIICTADNLPPEAHASVERKLRRLATGKQLQGGEQVSGRATWVYPRREVYRAALLNEFARQGVDVTSAEAAIRGAAFNLGRRDPATKGIDAIVQFARSADGVVLEVSSRVHEGDAATIAYVGSPRNPLEGEFSRLTINISRMVRAIDAAIAAGN